MGENDIKVEDLKIKIGEALDSINVTSAHVFDKGKIIVNIPDACMHSKATECRTNKFNDKFEISEQKFIPPKLSFGG